MLTVPGNGVHMFGVNLHFTFLAPRHCTGLHYLLYV